MLMVHPKIAVLLLLVKIKALNFIGKSLNLPPCYQCHYPMLDEDFDKIMAKLLQEPGADPGCLTRLT